MTTRNRTRRPAELNEQTSYAFATKVTNALGHTTYTKYDYYLGKPVTIEDANGIVSSIAYNDALDRPTQEIQARYKVTTPPCEPPSVCVPAEIRQTTITYDDTNRVTTTTSDLDTFNDNVLITKSYHDGLGRTWRGAASEGSTWMIKDTQFDALGRVSQVSNPYRAADPGSASPPSGLWTTTEYDALGRVIKVTTPDGAHIDTAYSGNNTLVIDQAGKKQISRTDALGRLTNVWEVRSPDTASGASGTVSISFPNHPEITAGYQTDYLYDALDNLRKVTQGQQKRWFAYDSLSRLIRAKNPEQDVNAHPDMSYTDPVTNDGNGWSMAYSYDPNGNLVSKTDARNITTTYGYDALNRNTTVSYSDSTPSITHTYDTATLGKGRLQKAETAGSLGSRVTINAYDALGRPRSKSQQFFHLGAWGTSYTTQQIYDLAGNIKRLTYPSDHTVDYSYDQAGRLSSFSGNLGGSQRTYADMIKYNAAGQMIKERFGTNTLLYHNSHYNNRMQMVSTRVGNDDANELNWSRGAINFFYGTTAVESGDKFANSTDNNGNLRRQINYVPLAVGGHVIPQRDDYTYDALNRVSTFTEIQMNSSGQWTPTVASQDFSYDRYGNRKITSATGIDNNYNPNYILSTNRIDGLGYDAAGNITSDPLTGGTMTYDAENRLLTATSGGGGSYVYNADGKRVRRITGGQETWHVYGYGGELLAEYAANAQPTAPQKEYGYRGGQLLIVAESGSGGGVSFVKPALKSGADLIGKAGPEADGNSDELFVADEPVADLEFNEDSSSTTADVSSENNTGTHIDGVTRTTAEGYGNAQSLNGIGGELLPEHRPAAAPGAPQKGYGYRSGHSIVTVTPQGVSVLNPTAYQTPDPAQGGVAIESTSNMGHVGAEVSASANAPGEFGSSYDSQSASARWFSFQSVPGQILSINLKFNWQVWGNVSGSVAEDGGSLQADSFLTIDFSLDNGANWTRRVTRGVGVGGNGFYTLSDSGAETIALGAGQNIAQIQVRDSLTAMASANGGEFQSSSASAYIMVTISNIRLEVETDTTAPVISNVAAGGITTTGATITWNTNENSDSQVEYGLTTAYGQSTTLNPALVTAHSQGLSGLTSGTLYHYRVKSRDASGNLAISGDFTFTTLDVTAPVISNVAAGGITASGATITWTSNENSDSQVQYGTTQAYGQSTTLDPTLVTAHSQGLSGLNSETLYHYRVKSKDAAGNLAVSGDFTFTTAPLLDTTPPTVTSFSPAMAATNVSRTVNVTVTFSEAVDPATVNGSTVELRDPSNALVSATVSYNVALLTATLNPTASLALGTTYTARVRGGGTDPRVKDVAGNALAADVTWTFTTAQSEIKWLVTDHLGSTRMVIDETGSLEGIKRHDFAPFGEELFAGVAIRSDGNGYSADSVRQKFVSKERDNETGLDYFGARYFASVQGRFTSPDDFLNDTHVSDPQSWNLYVYVRNNPLRYIDPTGEIKTNPDGSVTFDPDKVDKKTGKPKDSEFIYHRKQGEDGSITITKWRAVKGSIYTDNGTKITAFKATTAVSVEVTNSLGFVDKAASEAKTAALSGSDNSTDCHGVTFAQGQVWIDNPEVKKLMNNDGYRPLADNEAPQVGDVGIYAQGRKFDLGNTQHSVTVNSVLNGQVQNVISKGGISRRRISPPGPGAGTAWNSADNLSDKRNTQLKYFTKRVQQ